MRPLKPISELSPERLRKLSPMEIKRRQELEELSKEKIDISENKSIDLNDINSIADEYKTFMEDLSFINRNIELCKKDINKNGIFNGSFPILKDCLTLKSKMLKDLVYINKEVNNTNVKTENVAFVTPSNEDLKGILNEIEIDEVHYV